MVLNGEKVPAFKERQGKRPMTPIDFAIRMQVLNSVIKKGLTADLRTNAQGKIFFKIALLHKTPE